MKSPITVALAALTLAACNDQPVVEPTNVLDDVQGEATPTAVGAVTANAVTPDQGVAMEPQRFANSMAASDAYELESSRMAVERIDNGPLRAFAERMIKDHSRSTAALKAAASGMTLSPELNPMQRQMIADLRQSGDETFAERYKTQQIEAHQMAFEMLNGFAARGEHPELRAFAGQTAPVVSSHLRMLQEM